MAKLPRSKLLHFLQDTFQTSLLSTQSWYRIGKDVSNLSVNLNSSTETIKNILDETDIIDNGCEPAFDVDTYYCDPDDGDFYEAIKGVALDRNKGDARKTLCMEVLMDKTTGPFDAWVEDVIITATLYGGEPGGVRITYSVAFCGNRRKGTVTFDATTGKPTFTETV